MTRGALSALEAADRLAGLVEGGLLADGGELQEQALAAAGGGGGGGGGEGQLLTDRGPEALPDLARAARRARTRVWVQAVVVMGVPVGVRR